MSIKISYEDLLTFIPSKEHGVVTGKQLSRQLQCAESFVRRLINQARSNGVPICSTTNGYYLSDEHEDILETINFLTRRVRTQLKAIDGLVNIRHKWN